MRRVYFIILVLVLAGMIYGQDRSRYAGPDKAKGMATITISAADAPQDVRAKADFCCDGVDDQVEIMAAIARLPLIDTSTTPDLYGGNISFSAGNFSISETITMGDGSTKIYAILFSGAGGIYQTILKLADSADCSMFRIGYDPRFVTSSSTAAGKADWIDFRDITFDGNQANQTKHYYDITSADESDDAIVISGVDLSAIIKPHYPIRIYGSTNNDITTIVKSITYSNPNTTIVTYDGVMTDSDDSATEAGKLHFGWPLIDARYWQDGGMEHCFVEKSFGPGVYIANAWTVIFDKCPIEHNFGPGIMVGTVAFAGGSKGYSARNIHVNNCVFIQDSSATANNPPAGECLYFLLSGSGTDNQQHYITNNFFMQGKTGGIVLQGGVNEVLVSENHMHAMGQAADVTYDGIWLRRTQGNGAPHNIRILDNEIAAYDVEGAVNNYELRSCVYISGYSTGNNPSALTIKDNVFTTLTGTATEEIKSDYAKHLHGGGIYLRTEDTWTDITVDDDIYGTMDLSSNAGATQTPGTTAGTVQADYNRGIKVTFTDADSSCAMTARITGYGMNNEIIVEDVAKTAVEGTVTKYTTATFETITTITQVSCTGGGAGDAVIFGPSLKFQLSRRCAKIGNILMARKNNVAMFLAGVAVTAKELNLEQNIGYGRANTLQTSTVDFRLKSDGSTPATAAPADGDDLRVTYLGEQNYNYQGW